MNLSPRLRFCLAFLSLTLSVLPTLINTTLSNDETRTDEESYLEAGSGHETQDEEKSHLEAVSGDGALDFSAVRLQDGREATSHGGSAPASVARIETSPCKIMAPVEAKDYDLCAQRDEGRQMFGCTEEQDFIMPVDRRVFDVITNQWGPWETTGFFGCVDRVGASTAELTQVIEREFASLPITPSQATVQPGSGRTFVNIPTIVFTTNEPQTLNTTLLGTSLEVEVTPETFTWDFGDGSTPLVTTDPGAPYPNHTLDHTYTQPGQATITLTTAWAGRFRIVGSTEWITIPGTATTTTTTPTLEVREATSRLVQDPLT